MKNVTIKIIGKHIHDNIEEEQLELVTEAEMFERNGVLYLMYEESEFSGMEGAKTRLRIGENELKMTRLGEGTSTDGVTEMLFQEGKRFEDSYPTPIGVVEMEMLTNSYKSTMSYDQTGELDVDYTVSLKGLSEGRSKLHIEFIGEKSEEISKQALQEKKK